MHARHHKEPIHLCYLHWQFGPDTLKKMPTYATYATLLLGYLSMKNVNYLNCSNCLTCSQQRSKQKYNFKQLFAVIYPTIQNTLPSSLYEFKRFNTNKFINHHFRINIRSTSSKVVVILPPTENRKQRKRKRAVRNIWNDCYCLAHTTVL